MKKYIKWGALVFLVLCAFFSFTQIRKNTISGQITGAGEGDRIFLASYHASKDKFVTDDSAKVASDGTFTIKTQDKNELTLLFWSPKAIRWIFPQDKRLFRYFSKDWVNTP